VQEIRVRSEAVTLSRRTSARSERQAVKDETHLSFVIPRREIMGEVRYQTALLASISLPGAVCFVF
jgi:hypothetical protein